VESTASEASKALTVNVTGVPTTALAGSVASRVVAAWTVTASLTTIPPESPVIEGETVSMAVSRCVPSEARTTPGKVCWPASAWVKV
jgi:hypothetical protein